MNPNDKVTIEILSGKLANVNLEAAQWQSIANGLKNELDQSNQRVKELEKHVEETTKTKESHIAKRE